MTNLATLLRLTQPLAVLDCESTGLDPEKDRIIQLAITIHYPTRDPIAWQSLVNPGIAIPQNVHGLTDADVKDAPTFARIAPALAPKLLNVDICGYHVDFDIAFLRAEFKRADVDWPWNGAVVDALQVFRKKEPHSLANAYKRFAGTEMTGAHDASADVAATAEVLVAQLNEYQDLPRDVRQLSEWCFPGRLDAGGKFKMIAGVATCCFGKKWNGRAMRDIDVGYWDWILGQDFPADVKALAGQAKLGKYPEAK